MHYYKPYWQQFSNYHWQTPSPISSINTSDLKFKDNPSTDHHLFIGNNFHRLIFIGTFLLNTVQQLPTADWSTLTILTYAKNGVNNGKVKVDHVGTTDQLADIFTKSLG
jgi:hypothetical protein